MSCLARMWRKAQTEEKAAGLEKTLKLLTPIMLQPPPSPLFAKRRHWPQPPQVIARHIAQICYGPISRPLREQWRRLRRSRQRRRCEAQGQGCF